MKKLLGLFVLATMLAVPAMASAAAQVPAGFTVLSESRMPWAKAKTFCQQSGKLPLIGGSAKRSDVPDGTPIDGFGIVEKEGSWPKGLGSDCYWTGTAHSEDPSSMWVVCDNGGGSVPSVYFHARREDNGVVCVPK
jgi:hypothetical protein